MAERVRVRLTNRYAILEYPYPEEIKDYFAFRPKGYVFSPKYKLGVWDGTVSLLQRGKVGTGLFLERYREIEQDLGIRFRITDERVSVQYKTDDPRNMQLPGYDQRDYQLSCVLAMMQNPCGGVVLNATGSGKTAVAGMLFHCAVGTCLFVVDELTLLYQAKDELQQLLGETVGVIGDQQFDPRRVTVATIQTLHRYRENRKFRKWAADLDIMFVDEVHLMLNKRQQDTVRALQPKAVFGLTATLKLKRKEIRLKVTDLCGPVIFTYPYRQGVDEHVLAPGVVVGVDLKRSTHKAAVPLDYKFLYDEFVVRSEVRNDLLVSLVVEGVQRDKHVVLLVERLEHLHILHRMLNEEGVRHAVVCGPVKVDRRVRTKQRFENDQLRVILCNKVFKKGINLRKVDVIIDAASMVDPDDAVQKYGRGVRLSETKRGLIYFDIGERASNDEERGNQFLAATSSRRRALKRNGVPVIPLRARMGASALYEEAERQLSAVLKARLRKQNRLLPLRCA